MHPPIVLDCTGLLCPVPIHLTARKLEQLPVGGCVEVVCDDEAITQDLPSWCRLTGHAIVGHRQDGGAHHYVVRKS